MDCQLPSWHLYVLSMCARMPLIVSTGSCPYVCLYKGRSCDHRSYKRPIMDVRQLPPHSVVVMSLDDLRNVIGRDDPVFGNFRNPSFWFECEATTPSGNGHVLVLDWGCVRSYIGFGTL